MIRGRENSLPRVRSIVVIPDTRTIVELESEYTYFAQGISRRGGVPVRTLNSLLSDPQVESPVGLVCVGDGVKTALTVAGADNRVNRLALVTSGIFVTGGLLSQEPEDSVEVLAIASGEQPYKIGRRDLVNVGGVRFRAADIQTDITNLATQEGIVVFMGLDKESK